MGKRHGVCDFMSKSLKETIVLWKSLSEAVLIRQEHLFLDSYMMVPSRPLFHMLRLRCLGNRAKHFQGFALFGMAEQSKLPPSKQFAVGLKGWQAPLSAASSCLPGVTCGG